MDIKELKAYAFDLVNEIQKYNMELQRVSQLIQKEQEKGVEDKQEEKSKEIKKK